LGYGSETIRIPGIINERAVAGGDEALYGEGKSGGRVRTDGQLLKWIVTSPRNSAAGQPFFCEDVTPRELRVPAQNTEHPCTAQGIASLHLQAPSEQLDELSRNFDYIFGSSSTTNDAKREWQLDTVEGIAGPSCRLLLSGSDTQALELLEVAFFAKDEPPTNGKLTWGKIRFVVL